MMNNDESQRAGTANSMTPRVKSEGRGERARAEQKRQPSRLLMLAAFGAVYVIWGSTYLGIKYAIETLPPFLMAGARFLIAGGVLYGLARLGFGDAEKRRERMRPSHWRAAAIIGVLLFLCGNGGVTWAEGHIASSLAALLVASEPLWIVLLAWLLPGGGARPNGKVWLGLALGFAGVWMLVSAGASASAGGSDGGTNILGAGVVLASALAWAVGSVYSLRAPLPRSPLLSAGMQMLAGGSLLLLVGTLTGELARLDFHAVSMRSIVAFLYLTVFGSIVAFTAYSWLLRNASPARVSTYAYVNPAVAVLLGWALAGEAMTTTSLVAAGIIVASVALITSRGKGLDVQGDEKDGAAMEKPRVCSAGEAVHLS
jgi:drug/metabolite transporter (DMT)-like permease